MKNIRSYLIYFKLRLISNLQYRSAALAGMSTQFFFGFIHIMLYIAFYNNTSSINVPTIPIISFITGPSTSVTLSQMTTYLWLYQSLYYMFLIRQTDNELLDQIKTGNIAYELCKPLNLYFLWFIKIVAKKTIGTLLRFWPILLVSFFLLKPFNLLPPSSLLAFLLFLISLLFSLIIATIVTLFIHILTFYTLKDKGSIGLVTTISELFSGGIIPIIFMPTSLQIIAYLLPFRYISDLPLRIYNGTIPLNTSLINIGLQIFWIILLGLISYYLMNKALKRVIIQGG